MADLTGAQGEPHGASKKLSDYQKDKNIELQKSRDNPRSNKGTQGIRGTQPKKNPHAPSATNTVLEPAKSIDNNGVWPTTMPATSVGNRATLKRHAAQDPE